MNVKLFLMTIILMVFSTHVMETSIKFTNIRCDELDSEFATFKECHLKLVKRGTVALHIFVKLLKLPVDNVTINLSLLKKANGYKPFLYNVTTNFCQFMKNQKHNLFLKIFFDLLLKASNINHTCPYNHDIIVRKLVLQNNMFTFLPLPSGDYMFRLKVAAYNSWKADVKAYFQCINRDIF